jgi:hypothetical protein
MGEASLRSIKLVTAYAKVKNRSPEWSAVVIDDFAYFVKASVLNFRPITKPFEAASRNLDRRNISVDSD